MNCKGILFIIIFLILLNIVVAEENITSTENQALITNEINETNLTTEVIPEIEDISLKNFIPKEFKLGDAQFSIQIQNNKNEIISNIMAFVSGKGFSTYDVTPIDYLEAGEKGYILVNGNFKESGLIELTIRINQYIFSQNVTILGESQKDLERAEELLKQQEEKKKNLEDLSSKLDVIKQNYSALEAQLAEKKKNNYDITGISLEELKRYLRNTQASILGEHVEDAKVNLGLAMEEYTTLENKIANLRKLPKITRFREYAIIFSAIAGSIITLFALYELLKKKSTAVVSTITTIKQKTEKKEEPKIIIEEKSVEVKETKPEREKKQKKGTKRKKKK